MLRILQLKSYFPANHHGVYALRSITMRRKTRSMSSGAESNHEIDNLSIVRAELLGLHNEDKIKTMNITQLRSVMKKIAKSTKGTKQELLSRLAEFLGTEFTTDASEVRSYKREKIETTSTEEGSSKRVTKRKTTTVTTATVVHTGKPWTLLQHKKLKPEWVAYDPANRPEVAGLNSLKIISWNVNGLRACLKRGEEEESLLARLAKTEDFDIICLQETKLQEKDVDAIREAFLADYSYSFWTCSTSKLGYSGCALISRIKPLSVTYGLGISDHDGEGRLVTAEFDSFYLVSAYVPNSGQKLERLEYRTTKWDSAFSSYMLELERKKPVVLTGDLNCAHEEIDIHDPDGNRRNAGFTNEERTSFQENFLNKGLVDTFRRQHPLAVGFTYWSYRSNARPQNKGWRLDYFLVSQGMTDQVLDSYILPHVHGSDHCPVGLILSK